jgi:hypothetical protein
MRKHVTKIAVTKTNQVDYTINIVCLSTEFDFFSIKFLPVDRKEAASFRIQLFRHGYGAHPIGEPVPRSILGVPAYMRTFKA